MIELYNRLRGEGATHEQAMRWAVSIAKAALEIRRQELEDAAWDEDE